MLNYKLASLVPQARRKGPAVQLPQIHGAVGAEASYLKVLRGLLRTLGAALRDEVLPGVGLELKAKRAAERGPRMTGDDAGQLTNLAELANGLSDIAANTVTPILSLEAERHTAHFIASAKSALGVDLSTVVRTEDLAGYLETASLRNAGLIKGLSQLTVTRVSNTVTNAVLNGVPAAELRAKLTADFGFADSRAKVIARDQIAKTSSELNRIRHKQAGIETYIWRTSHDERVRPLHKGLDGIVYKMDEPTGAEGGAPPGQPILCRCIAQAVVDFGTGAQVQEAPAPASTSTTKPAKAPKVSKPQRLRENSRADVKQSFDKLGSMGDNYVQSPNQFFSDPDLNDIMAKGIKLDAKSAGFIEGVEGNCHWNTARLLKTGEIDQVVVGYAENSSGWLQHTWGLKNGRVIETNPSTRLQGGVTNYFGVPLDTKRSQDFADFVLRPENAPGNGNVRTIKGARKWVS